MLHFCCAHRGPADTRPVTEEIASVKILLLAMAASVVTGRALQCLYAKKAAWEKLSHSLPAICMDAAGWC